MSPDRLLVLPSLFLIAGLTQASPTDQKHPFVVSEDGHETAMPLPGPVDPGIPTSRGPGVPFPLTPDDTIELRRQIGGLRVADMNNDGHNDLVAVCYVSNSFPPFDDWRDMIFLGDGTGIESTPSWVSTLQTHTADALVDDLNGDTLPDLVTVHGGSVRTDPARVYLGTPTGPATTASYQMSVPGRAWGTAGLLADMDNDGDPDLITTNQGLSSDPFRPMLMFRNNAGTIGASPVWQSAESSIQNGLDAADINGDGFLDLAVAKWVNFQSGVYFNLAGTPDVNQGLFAGNTSAQRHAEFIEVDGSPLPEIAVGGDPAQIFQLVHGTMLPIWASNPPFGSAPQDLVAFDIDDDGDEDLAEVIFADGRAHIYLNNDGSVETIPSWTFDASETGTALTFGDLNGDGLEDLIVGYSGDTCIRIFYAEAPPCPADLAEPFGVLNFFDLGQFLTLFNAQNPSVDYAAPFGVWNFFDLGEFLSLFNQGCP